MWCLSITGLPPALNLLVPIYNRYTIVEWVMREVLCSKEKCSTLDMARTNTRAARSAVPLDWSPHSHFPFPYLYSARGFDKICGTQLHGLNSTISTLGSYFNWHDMILFVPRLHIRLRPEISIAPYPWLPSQVLSISFLLFSFLPWSSSSKFLVDVLSSFFHYPVSILMQFVLCYLGLYW